MIKYVKYQNKNEDSKAYGKWYARLERLKRLKRLSVFFTKHTFAERQNG